MQDRPGPFTLREGAAALGISLNTLRRRIATGQVRAERVERPQGFVWQVYLNGAAPSQDGANETVQRDRPGTVHQPPTGIAQAEAMAAYTRSILEPLVTRLAEQETTIRDQAETIGRQGAELERAASTIVALAEERDALRASQTKQGANPGPDPSTPTTDAPLPLTARLRALAPWVLGLVLALIVVVALLVGPR